MLAPINFMGIVIRALRGYTHCDPDTHLKLTRPPAPHLLCHYPGDQGHISEGILGRNLFNTTQLCTRIPKGDFPATTRCGSNWFECSHLPRVFIIFRPPLPIASYILWRVGWWMWRIFFFGFWYINRLALYYMLTWYEKVYNKFLMGFEIKSSLMHCLVIFKINP